MAIAAVAAVWVGPMTASAQPTGSANGLTATLGLTKEPEEFVRRWATSSEAGKPPIESTKIVKFGEYIAALTSFRGCATSSGACRVYADYELVAPDGSVRYRIPDREGAAEPRAGQDHEYLSHALVRFEFKAGDPTGLYTIRAVVREPARGNAIQLSEHFRLVE
jgi:hypothetical protein